MTGTRHIEYSSEGFPIYAFREGGSYVATSSGTTSSSVAAKLKDENFGSVVPNKKEFSGSREWVPWGRTDRFPDEVFAEVRKSGVAMSALRLLNYKLFGQQLIPVIEEGLDDNKEMKYSLVKDAEVTEFLKRSNIDRWRISNIQDYNFLGITFPSLMMNADRSKVVKVGHDKARKYRYLPYDQSTGRIDKIMRSANFPAPSSDARDKEITKVINSADWYEEVERIRYTDGDHRYIFPTYFPDAEYDYYPRVAWDAIRENGWLEISNSIPEYKRAIFRNQSSIKYHVKIHQQYWLNKFPKWASMSVEARTVEVNKQLDEMDKYLTGTDNAMRTFVSFFETDRSNGKESGHIIIEPIDDKLKSDAYLPDGAAANAEILFSMLVNPAVFGVGMPGGSYTGGANNGGSNIRESWLVMNAINSADRAILYHIFDFVREYNGWNPDMKLITLDKVLTTTDTGRGTKIVS